MRISFIISQLWVLLILTVIVNNNKANNEVYIILCNKSIWNGSINNSGGGHISFKDQNNMTSIILLKVWEILLPNLRRFQCRVIVITGFKLNYKL